MSHVAQQLSIVAARRCMGRSGGMLGLLASCILALTGPVIARCPGDVNSDGVVNTADLGTLLASYGSTVTRGTSGDLNNDGVVNTIDLGLLLGAFGSTCPVNVPHPEIHFHFDGGLVETTPAQLTTTFTRSYRSTSPGGGAIVDLNTPRYWQTQRLLCGLPTPTTAPVNGTPGVFVETLAGGVATDSTTPLFVQFSANPAWVDVVRGGSASHSWRTYGLVSPSTPDDLLNGCQGHGGSDPRPWELNYNVFHGLIAAICQVQQPNSFIPAVWSSARTGLCYTDESQIAAGAQSLTWNLQWIDPQIVDEGHARGASYACQDFRTFDPGPVLHAWLAFSDYQHNNSPSNSLTANYYLVRASRDSDGSPWSFGNVQRVLSYTLSQRPAVGMHAHPPALDQYGASGLCMLCPIGDSRGNNRVVAVYRDDASTYDQGEADSTEGGVRNGWTTRLVNGSAGAVPPAYNQYAGTEGNQFVGSAPLPTPGSQLIGGDEAAVPVMATAIPTNQTGDGAIPASLNFSRLWGQPAGGMVQFATYSTTRTWNIFRIARAGDRSGPYCLKVSPGATWTAAPDAARLLFSPDGAHWAPFFASRDTEATDPVAIAGNGIYCAFVNSLFSSGPPPSPPLTPPFPVYSVELPFPSTLLGGPLAIGGPGDNAGSNLLWSPLTATASDGANSIAALGQLPPGVPPPPSLGDVLRCRIIDGNNAGTVALTAPGAVPAGTIKLRMWVYLMPWSIAADDSFNPNSNGLSLQVSIGACSNGSVASSRQLVELGPIHASGSWIPVTIDTNSASWMTDYNAPSPQLDSTFQLGVRLASGGSTQTGANPHYAPNPCDFLVAVDSVTAAGPAGNVDYPGLALPPAASGLDPERLALGGFSCGPDWSILMASEIPDDCWDNTVPDRSYGQSVCTFYESPSSWIKVAFSSDYNLAVPTPSWSSESGKGAVRFTIQTNAGQHRVYVSPAQVRPQGQGFGAERFSFQRGNPVYLGVTTGGANHNVVTCYAAVGGTTLASATLTLADGETAPRPVQVQSGSETQAMPEAMYWWGGLISASTALDTPTVVAHFTTLDFLGGTAPSKSPRP